MNLNNVCIGGTLTRDPELRHTQSGMAVCNFTVAINKNWLDQNGQKKEKASFVDVKFWGKGGEVIAEWFGKGGQICVTGELEQESWETDGQKRSKLVVLGRGFEFCGKNRSDSDEPTVQKAVKKEVAKAIAGAPDDDDDEIPF